MSAPNSYPTGSFDTHCGTRSVVTISGVQGQAKRRIKFAMTAARRAMHSTVYTRGQSALSSETSEAKER